MSPRDFIGFFKTRSGRIISFGIVFAGGLILFSNFRKSSGEPDDIVVPRTTNQLDKPQVVQSIERPVALFRPPAPKPEPSPAPRVIERPKPPTETPKSETTTDPLSSISLFADSTAGVIEPKSRSLHSAPFGRLISCQTVITVDSGSIQTPIIGLVIEDVFHAGKLIIPAGTEVHGTAQTDRQRERIASGGSWTLVWQSGEELGLKAVALDREFSGDQEGWGITDGSAGLRGRVIKTDDMAEIKLYAATLLSGAASALTEKETTLFGSIDRPSVNNAPLKGAQDILKVYSKRILEAIQRDGFYVRVPSGKQFYLYVLQTIDPSEAIPADTALTSGQDTLALPSSNEFAPATGAPVPSQTIVQP